MPKLLTSTDRCLRYPSPPEPRAIAARMGPTRHRRGFTMFELVLALTIIAITTAMAAPRVNVMLRHQKVDRASQVVASDIRAAFTSAARGRVPVRIDFVFASRRYAITNRVTGDTIIQRDLSSGDLGVGSLEGSNASLQVFPSGIATSSDTIRIGDAAAYVRRIAISRAGAVRVVP